LLPNQIVDWEEIHWGNGTGPKRSELAKKAERKPTTMTSMTSKNKDDKSLPDKSPLLTLTFSEQQWITVGVAISERLSAPDCHPIEEENLRPVALRLQQVSTASGEIVGLPSSATTVYRS
jgi:hypothetical protein